MQPVIRPATRADLNGMVEVFLGCWKVSYSGVLPDQLVDRMDQARAEQLWNRVVEKAGGIGLLVAVEPGSDTVIGITRFVVDGGEAMVHSLYVSPDAQGRGVGALLLEAACNDVADAGAGLVRLWVFAANTPSRGFYERQGFYPDGTTRVQEEFGEPEVRLIKHFDADSSAGVGRSCHR